MEARITLLPSDVIWEIARHILADDGVSYVYFRAACKDFWSFLPDIRNLGFCFLLRSWIMLYNKKAIRSRTRTCQIRYPCFQQIDESRNKIMIPHRRYICISELDRNTLRDTYQNCIQNNDTFPRMDRTHCSFLNLWTGRCVKLFLPELETHSILSATDGFFILFDNRASAMRIFNPLTRCLSADLPPTLTKEDELFNVVTAVAPSGSTLEQPTLLIAGYLSNTAYFAKPGEQISIHMQLPFSITSALFSKGLFYCTDLGGSIWEIEPEQNSVGCVFFRDAAHRYWDLVQTRTGMLVLESSPRSLARKIDPCGDDVIYVREFDLNADKFNPMDYTKSFIVSVGDAPKTQRIPSVTNAHNQCRLLLLRN